MVVSLPVGVSLGVREVDDVTDGEEPWVKLAVGVPEPVLLADGVAVAVAVAVVVVVWDGVAVAVPLPVPDGVCDGVPLPARREGTL